MPIVKILPPKPSLAKLRGALLQLVPLKERRKRWMRLHLSLIRPRDILFPHPFYSVGVHDLLAGRTLGDVLRRVGWMYFLRNPKSQLACAEVSIVAGKHTNFRLTEGPFVRNAFRVIQLVQKDPRLRRRSFKLRSVRVESLHAFVLWLSDTARSEFWITVAPVGDSIAPMQWFTRKEFSDLLVNEAARVVTARERAAQLAKQG
jgi:hypothetical protein